MALQGQRSLGRVSTAVRYVAFQSEMQRRGVYNVKKKKGPSIVWGYFYTSRFFSPPPNTKRLDRNKIISVSRVHFMPQFTKSVKVSSS